MTDADSDKQAHAEIAKANAAMPQRMSDREFRERVMAMTGFMPAAFVAHVDKLIAEWRRRNG